jgi:hypothetical protein
MAIAFDARTLSRLSFHTMGRYPDTINGNILTNSGTSTSITPAS